jgi:hypothetical protein
LSTKREQLVQGIAELVACSAMLRDQLERYETTMSAIGRRVEAGTPAVVASAGTEVPLERRQVTEAIQDFEAARHQLRLVLFALGRHEGASISEIGRVLGISRQLASRLAGESDVAET